MKKAVAALMMLLGSALLGARANYSIRCYKCEEAAKRHRYEASCIGCPTWRIHAEETKEHFVYRCKHGHTLHVDKKTGEKR